MKIGSEKYILILFGIVASLSVSAQKEFLVCGDSKVLLVDYKKSKDTIPHISWEWDASKDSQLPEIYRTQKFRTMADCKLSRDGKQLLAISSSGGVALLSFPDKKLLFLTEVGNVHSIEFLPGGLIAVAGSIHPRGNSLEIYNPAVSNKPLAKDSLYSGHGVVWHAKKKLLYALGYDVLRAYSLDISSPDQPQLTQVKEWSIPGESGHDLFLTANGKQLYITEHTDAWAFDLASEKFDKIKDFPTKENIKSIGRNKAGQIIYTEPEESWWTFSVKFINPERKFGFPGMKVYKARWTRL